MSWPELLDIIREEVGEDTASRIEDRAMSLLGGCRITILRKKLLTAQDIDQIAPGRPKEAAQKLNVSLTTVYRAMRRPMIR